jgi:hypothetical protein
LSEVRSTRTTVGGPNDLGGSVTTLAGWEFLTNMIVKKRQDIDVILGMNWLTLNKAIINTDQRTIKLSYGHEEVQLFIPIAVLVKASGQVFETIV